MSNWGTYTIAELAAPKPAAIAIGPFGSRLTADNYVASGVPVVRGQNISDGKLLEERDIVYVSSSMAQSLSSCIAHPGDLVFPHRGAIGRVGIVTDHPWLLSTSMMKVSLNTSLASPEFVFYFFRGPGRSALLQHASVVGTPGIAQPLTALKSIRVPLPPLSEQRAIAEVLGALDDKIAANDHTSRLAVSLADAEFERAASQVIGDSVAFEEVADIGGGGTPKTSVDEYWNGGIFWATPTDVTGLGAPYLHRTGRTISEDGLAACSSKLYPAGSILMTSRATIGAFALARASLAVNQGFIVVNARDHINQLWLFHEMRARVDEFVSHANGATFLELPRSKFKKLRLRMPNAIQARAFASRVGPIHDMAAQLMTETAMLGATRDELLPLLISGRIRVRDAEKVVEEVV